MKPPSNPCSKHPSSIPQAMLGGCPMLCLMRARRCLCVLRTPDCVLRTPYFGFRFSVFAYELQSYLSLACLLTASRSFMQVKNPKSNPKPKPVKVSLI